MQTQCESNHVDCTLRKNAKLAISNFYPNSTVKLLHFVFFSCQIVPRFIQTTLELVNAKRSNQIPNQRRIFTASKSPLSLALRYKWNQNACPFLSKPTANYYPSLKNTFQRLYHVPASLTRFDLVEVSLGHHIQTKRLLRKNSRIYLRYHGITASESFCCVNPTIPTLLSHCS